MAIIKSISIHKTVIKALKYILDEDKIDTLNLIEGINCDIDADIINEQFKSIKNLYNHKK